jgi:hypothetical protein
VLSKVETLKGMALGLLIIGGLGVMAGLMLMRVDGGASLIISGSILASSGAVLLGLSHMAEQIQGLREAIQRPSLITPSVFTSSVALSASAMGVAGSETLSVKEEVLSSSEKPVTMQNTNQDAMQEIIQDDDFHGALSAHESQRISQMAHAVSPRQGMSLGSPTRIEIKTSESKRLETVLAPQAPTSANDTAGVKAAAIAASVMATAGLATAGLATAGLATVAVSALTFSKENETNAVQDTSNLTSLEASLVDPQHDQAEEGNNIVVAPSENIPDLDQLISAALSGLSVEEIVKNDRQNLKVDQDGETPVAFEVSHSNPQNQEKPSNDLAALTSHMSADAFPSHPLASDPSETEFEDMLSKLALPHAKPFVTEPFVTEPFVNAAQTGEGETGVADLIHTLAPPEVEPEPVNEAMTLDEHIDSAILSAEPMTTAPLSPPDMTVAIHEGHSGASLEEPSRILADEGDLNVETHNILSQTQELEPNEVEPKTVLSQEPSQEALLEQPADTLSEASETPAIVGRYVVGEHTYVMFSDGSIEAITSEGMFRFSSMADLKAFIQDLSAQNNSVDFAHPHTTAGAA